MYNGDLWKRKTAEADPSYDKQMIQDRIAGRNCHQRTQDRPEY